MKMKKIICFISLVLFGEILSAAALPEPILDYDFTAPVIVQRGKYKQQPKFVTAPEIATPVQALKLTKNNYITVPQSADMTIKNGMTFHAVVNFSIDKEIKNKTNTLDMIFFKPGEFLFGKALVWQSAAWRRGNCSVRCSISGRGCTTLCRYCANQ